MIKINEETRKPGCLADRKEFGDMIALALRKVRGYGNAEAIRAAIRRREENANFYRREWNDSVDELCDQRKRAERAEREAEEIRKGAEKIAAERDDAEESNKRLSDKLRQAKANAGDMAAEADRERDRANDAEAERDEWRDLYYSAAERADREAARAGKANARREGAEARGYRFAVVYRALDGFTENRRRIVIGPLASASSWSGEVHDEIERNRRPCERVHSVERRA